MREVCRSLLDPCAIFHERTGSEIVLDNFHALPLARRRSTSARSCQEIRTRSSGGSTWRWAITRRVRAPQRRRLARRAPRRSRRGSTIGIGISPSSPCHSTVSPDYCRSLAAVIGAILGRTKKCLILDLDNTLWGGVIGDDGLAGIQIGEGRRRRRGVQGVSALRAEPQGPRRPARRVQQERRSDARSPHSPITPTWCCNWTTSWCSRPTGSRSRRTSGRSRRRWTCRSKRSSSWTTTPQSVTRCVRRCRT